MSKEHIEYQVGDEIFKGVFEVMGRRPNPYGDSDDLVVSQGKGTTYIPVKAVLSQRTLTPEEIKELTEDAEEEPFEWPQSAGAIAPGGPAHKPKSKSGSKKSRRR